MRDFDAIKKKEMSSIENRVRHVYNIGYETGYAEGQKHDLEHTENIVRSHEKCKSVLEAEYERGLNDAWRVVTEFLLMGDFDRGMTFNTRFLDELLKLEPQNAVERLKEYNKKQEPIVKCCKNCKHSDKGMVGSTERCESCYYDGVSKGNTLFEPMEKDNSKIEVGDEVKRADIDKSLVIIKFTEEGWALGMNEEGNISDVKLSVYKKTGKHFDQIVEVFNSLKGDIDA